MLFSLPRIIIFIFPILTNLKPKYCPIGDGNINFENVIEAARESGTEYFIVEQDNAALLPDTLGQVERSAKYVTKNLI